MIKFVHDEIWFPDAEWVPDVEAGRRIYGATGPEEREAVSDQLVVETMFRDHPKYDANDNPRPFLKTVLCRMVAICFVREKGDRVTLHMIEADDEKALLELFLHHAGKASPQLVTFNGRDADLPAIVQRAMVHNIEARAFMKRPDKPWLGRDYFDKNSGWHIDLATDVANYQNKPSLSEACAAMNIVGPKTMTGADVLDLWLKGTPEAMREIRLYCLLDCVRLYLIWLRLGRLAGFYPEDVARENAASALRQYEDLASPLQIPQEELPLGHHEDQTQQRAD